MDHISASSAPCVAVLTCSFITGKKSTTMVRVLALALMKSVHGMGGLVQH